MGVTSVVLIVSALALLCGVILALAARYLAVPEDPRVAEVTALLPGVNCGACGYAGCADYARVLVQGGVSTSLCAPGGPVVAEGVAERLGLAVGSAEKRVALVFCGGGDSKATRRAAYNGIADCAAAAATAGGDKGCTFGCLGYGSCLQVCPTRAINLVDGIAVVDSARCVACGLCVKKCPRALIHLVPADALGHVLCSSKAKGPEVKKVCKTGCIGCTICTKTTEGAVAMNGFLAVRDYSKPIAEAEAEGIAQKCPGKCVKAGKA